MMERRGGATTMSRGEEEEVAAAVVEAAAAAEEADLEAIMAATTGVWKSPTNSYSFNLLFYFLFYLL
jgi:hypothetical protein